jgi:tryptophan synthase alpha chain
MSRYGAMFARLAAAQEGAFGAFLMLGDPSPAESLRLMEAALEGGADMLEVGIPFSDPVADGPVIQAAAERARAAGTDVSACLDLIAAMRARRPDVPIGILTYANIVAARGREAFATAAAKAGADSLLVADVPFIEAAPYLAAARAAGIDPVLIAAANTPAPRLAEIARHGGGYTYCLARSGVTGAGEAVHFDHAAMLRALREGQAPPAVFGFGISAPAHVRAAVQAGAAGVISGSAIVQRVGDGPEAVRSFVAQMKAAS